jgi:hypothetical protein
LVIVCWLSLSPLEIMIAERISNTLFAREALLDLFSGAHGWRSRWQRNCIPSGPDLNGE